LRSDPPAVAAPARIAGIDLLRGLVIVIMALDHARDYFSAFAYEATDLSQASPLLFLTRWITHFCAPVFMFLAGTSAWLHARNNGLSRGALQRFLLTRGLWLVFLELTWNSFMWRFSLDGIQVQVLWALGWSMVVLAAMLWLPRSVIVCTGFVIVGAHNLLDGIHASDFGNENDLPVLAWYLLHQPHFGRFANGFEYGELYPLLPWVGVMMLGYGFGAVTSWEKSARERFMILTGGVAIGLFLVLRLNNLYGEPVVNAYGHDQLWRENPRGPLFTMLGIVNLTKYPPSLDYLLMTLGTALLLLPLLERWRGRLADIFSTFGRVPMFFYLLHVPLIHLISIGAVYLLFGPVALDINSPADVPASYVPSLWPVYGGWIFVVMLLYPLCRAYAGYKRRHREYAWLSYL